MRSVSGGLPVIAHAHDSQTCLASAQRARFWPTKLAPIQRTRSTPRAAGAAQTQHRSPSGSAPQTAIGGEPWCSCSRREAVSIGPRILEETMFRTSAKRSLF